MIRKFSRDISVSAVQVVLNQVAGLLVFIITSRLLEKNVYGELNWSLAFVIFITTILSMRLEQVVVRKVAAGEDPEKILALFAGHILMSSLVFFLALIVSSFIWPLFFDKHYLLLSLAVSQLLIFVASPYRHIVNGREQFGYLAVIAVTANVTRLIMLVIAIMVANPSIDLIITIYIISSLAELLISAYLVHFKMKIIPRKKWSLKNYLFLMSESLPQIGAAFMNASIARIDWILLGLFFTNQVVTAEYSFAYKIFELSPIPLLVISPILLSRFSKFFSNHTEADLLNRKDEISVLIRIEMIFATFLPLLLNILWSPLFDAITEGKYGTVNRDIFFILSICVPFQYMTNLFWTITFAQNRLTTIFRLTAVVCAIIIIGDLLMIPVWAGRGAAFVYLAATVTEYLLYLNNSPLKKIKDSWQPLVTCITMAFASGLVVYFLEINLFLKLASAAIIYFILIIFTGQFSRTDIVQWLPYFKKARNEQGPG